MSSRRNGRMNPPAVASLALSGRSVWSARASDGTADMVQIEREGTYQRDVKSKTSDHPKRFPPHPRRPAPGRFVRLGDVRYEPREPEVSGQVVQRVFELRGHALPASGGEREQVLHLSPSRFERRVHPRPLGQRAEQRIVRAHQEPLHAERPRLVTPDIGATKPMLPEVEARFELILVVVHVRPQALDEMVGDRREPHAVRGWGNAGEADSIANPALAGNAVGKHPMTPGAHAGRHPGEPGP